MPDQVTIITGGASGMGFGVAQSLFQRGNWQIHLLDINAERGHDAAKQLHPKATFHRADVTKYDDLTKAFRHAFEVHGQIDFVLANAGVIEKMNFYAVAESDEPPPEPSMPSIDADLRGIVLTSYLALHYFRRSPSCGKGASLVMTASACGLYPTLPAPLYGAAKHGVIGFMRSIAPIFFAQNGIRVNAICPGPVLTNLMGKAAWDTFPADQFIAMETITRFVLMLVDGRQQETPEQDELVDATGYRIPSESAYGRTVEISLDKFYFREHPEFCDEGMSRVMGATPIEVQRLEKGAPK